MDEQIKKALASIKEAWGKLAPKMKKTILFGAAGVLVLSLSVALYLNMESSKFVTLYKGMDRQEASQVYAVLQEMGMAAQMDESGNVRVPAQNADTLRLELAAKGYPRTGLSYDVFSSNVGLTTTESDRKVYLTKELEMKQQDTLARMSGVEKAVVTLNLANDSSYVWEQDTQKSTASVLLTLRPGVELTPEQVSAVKVTIASGAPKLAPADVKVVDAATSIELRAKDELSAGTLAGELERLGFERQIEKSLEEKAQKQLSLYYGADQQRVSATVVLDYSKMIQESMQYKPEEGNTGVVDELQESWVMNPGDVAQGIPGEENNTDNPIPNYVDQNGDGVPEYVNHQRNINYTISYIKQQVEKGQAEMTSASIAVLVKDQNLDQERKDILIEQVSKATNIPMGNISVATLEQAVPTPEPTDTQAAWFQDPLLIGIIAVGLAALLIIIFMVVRMTRKKKPKEVEPTEAELALQEQQRLQKEIDDKKRMLKDAADAKAASENAVSNDVRDFARDNPEITASLIRSWLKEDE